MNLTRRIGLFAALLTLLALLPGAAAAAPPAAAADQAGAAPLPVAKPESVGMSSERLQRLSDAMAGYIDRKQVAGIVTLVARRGKVVHFEAQGDRWPEEGAPMTRDTIFRIASMTKPIASVALMTLYEEGRFQLRDPIAKYLPESKVDRFAALYRPGEDGTIVLTEAPDLNARQVREPHKFFSGAGGLVSTAADYYRFHQMMLSGGELDGNRVLGRKIVELMTQTLTYQAIVD